MNFADLLKEVRRRCLISQEGLANELHVSFCTVNRWETGRTQPHYNALKAFKAFCAENGIEIELVNNSWRIKD